MNSDLIIVGAGTAGLACAVIAARNCLRVIVVEKSDRVGGTLYLTGGHLSGAGTRRQRACGIQDSPDKHFEEVMAIGDQEADPDLVRLAVEEAPRTIDWLDDLGFPFAPETPAQPDAHESYSVPRTYWADDRGLSVLRTIRPLWDRHVTAGHINPLMEHECVEFVREDGVVQGVRAVGPEGEVVIRAENTVLATGGYGANPEFYAEVSPGEPPLVTNAARTSTGDGIQLAMDHGAEFRNADLRVPTLGGIETEAGSSRTDYTRRWARVTPSDERQPYEIYVTADGERFIAEDASTFREYQQTLLDRSIYSFWVVFDDHGLEAAEQPVVRDYDRDEIRDLADEGDVCWRADTLRSLAQKAGIDPGCLEESVGKYNEAVQTGDDPFGRSVLPAPIEVPPYYAVKTHDTTLTTHGGLNVNDSLQVLDTDGEPIPGLYAAGEALGAGATSGTDFASGMLLTPALSFGRILGRRLAPGRCDE